MKNIRHPTSNPLIVCTILCFCALLQICTATPADRQEILDFANHLFEQEDYYRAITEYERYIFLTPGRPQTALAEYQIALSYLYGERYEQAFQRLSRIATEHPDDSLGRAATFALANGYYDQKQYQNAIQSLESISLRKDLPKAAEGATLFSGLCHMRLRQYEQAREAFNSVEPSSAAASQAQILLNATSELEHLPLKKPWLAGTLSAVLPGAGQLYADRPRDAAVSFALNGVLIWGTIESFNNDQYVTGGLLGIIELGWYLGNIYNAINSTHKFNRQQETTFFDKLQIKYTPPFNDPESSPAVSVNYTTGF